MTVDQIATAFSRALLNLTDTRQAGAQTRSKSATTTPDIRAKRLASLAKARAAKAAKASLKAKACSLRPAKALTGGSADELLCEGAALFAGVNRAGRPYAGMRFGDEYGASCVVRKKHLPVWKRMLAPKAYATLEAFVGLYSG